MHTPELDKLDDECEETFEKINNQEDAGAGSAAAGMYKLKYRNKKKVKRAADAVKRTGPEEGQGQEWMETGVCTKPVAVFTTGGGGAVARNVTATSTGGTGTGKNSTAKATSGSSSKTSSKAAKSGSGAVTTSTVTSTSTASITGSATTVAGPTSSTAADGSSKKGDAAKVNGVMAGAMVVAGFLAVVVAL